MHMMVSHATLHADLTCPHYPPGPLSCLFQGDSYDDELTTTEEPPTTTEKPPYGRTCDPTDLDCMPLAPGGMRAKPEIALSLSFCVPCSRPFHLPYTSSRDKRFQNQ